MVWVLIAQNGLKHWGAFFLARFLWFEQQEKNGYAVISRDEWRAKLDDAAQDGYAEGRKDEREATVSEFAALLPGAYYMDPSDGGNISTLEQFKRMAQDAKMWREHQERARLAVACELRCEG